MYTGAERRRRDLPGRLARATWPARRALGTFVEGLPCNVIGHKWVEIPKSLRLTKYSDGRRMRFKCSRCNMIAGS
jgi:hypothetical protein